MAFVYGKIKGLSSSPPKKRPGAPRGKESLQSEDRSRYLYKKLSSITTSIYLLSFTVFFYIIGTIFPQGEKLDDYIKAGGKYVFFVRLFDLLDLFSSPLFLLSALALFLNLAVCVYDRYLGLFRKRVFPKTFKPDKTIYLTHGIHEAQSEVRRVLRENFGFSLASKDGDWVVMEKGLPYRILTLGYHGVLAVLFIGFILTYLFAYEGTLTLYPAKAESFSPDTTGRVQSLWKKKEGQTGFGIVLEEFSSEYIRAPRLNYPKDKLSRLAVGLGWKAPAYEIKEDSVAPKDWTTRLQVTKGGKTVLTKTVKVNDPLRYGGYTFYQTDSEQKIKVRIDSSPILLEARADEDLFVPGIENPVRFGVMRTGTLLHLDGAVEKLVPYTIVRQALPQKNPKEAKKYEDIGRLDLNGSIIIDGKKVAFADYDEAAVLSYRFDPGVPVLWWGGIILLALMALRFYSSFCTAAYSIGESDGIVTLDVNVTTRGLLADKKRILDRLEYYLTRDDIRPSPLPPSQ